MKDLTKKKYVYESPDGGKTVYAREVGTHTRKVIKSSPQQQNLRSMLLKQQQWHNILKHSETDDQLRQLVEQVEIYYRLKYAEN